MKKLLLFLLICLLSFNTKAQDPDPQLFVNDWFVQKVVIDNEDFYPPNYGFYGIIYFFSDFMGVDHPPCEEGFESTIDYINNDVFNISNGGVAIIGICADPDKVFFMGKHYVIYHDITGLAKNPFTYTIENDNDLLVLTITNMDGDQAIYINELLSTEESILSSITIYPNPVKDNLRIDNTSTTEITSIKLYDLLGRLVMTREGDIEQIDVSHLDGGVLFVEVETDEGIVTKKIIKE